jgi:hypothetical protein
MLKAANTARTLHAISPQSTIYCPIIDPPQNVPNHLSLDPRSEWDTSALIASAVESVTLPSRLRPYRDFEASLAGHTGGTQTIFELQSSILHRDQDKRASGITPRKDKKSTNEEAKTDFDLNFTFESSTPGKETMFTQVQVFRGDESDSKDEEVLIDDVGLSRKMQLSASKPAVERYLPP